MDVGSGAGLPGIPIKVLLPGKQVTLLEPRRRRANFLRHVIRTLQLRQIRVLQERIEGLNGRQLEVLDEMIARAFTDNEGFLRAGAKLLAPNGRCLLMHGPKGLGFLENTRNVLEALHLKALPPKMYRLPFGAEERTVLFFVKT
jgi:16S rRNA (guanine527-N7)-methyltransferase